MNLWSCKRPSPTAMLPLPERYKRANEFLRAEIRRVKDLHEKELAERDSMIQDLNEKIQRLQQQQQHPARALSKSSSSSLSTTRSNRNYQRRNSFSASTNSTSSLLRMAELASISSSLSNSLDEDESINSHNVVNESFLSMPTEPLTEGDEEAEEEQEKEEEDKKEKDILSQTKNEESANGKNGDRPDDDDKEPSSDQLPQRNHSLSVFVKSTSKKFVRRMSMKKKATRPFLRRQLRRKGTPLPTTADILKEPVEKKEEGPCDIHFNPAEKNDEESHRSIPGLDSSPVQRKASIYSNSSSSEWSNDRISSNSPHRLEQTKRSSVWSIEALPSDSTDKPKRATIASTTVQRVLPRELSLDRIVSDEESDEEEDDLLQPSKEKSSIHTVEVHCRHIVDARNRRGLYSGSLDLKTQLPHGQGSMSYPDSSRYSGSWKKGHWQGKAIHRDGNGSVYNGYFVRDQKEGTGILRYASGKTFEGRFKADHIREGTMTDTRTGSTHEGLFANGRCHGFGSHQYSNGVQFRGQYVQGERHGHGMILLPDGATYTGDFQNDLAHGIGESVNGDGTVEHTGQWDGGHPVYEKIYHA